MVDVTAPLSERQMEVLRWVADGCPDSGMRDAAFKRTARALQDRRLVRVSRPGGVWSAVVTDAGRHYLAHDHHPDAASSRQPPRVRRQRTSTDAHNTGPSSGAAASERPAITAELVLFRLRQAGGELVVSGVDGDELAAWRRAAKVAQLRLLRAGRQRLNRWTDGNTLRLQLDLVPAADADDDELTAEDFEVLFRASAPPPVVPRTAEFAGRHVPVPSTVTKPHRLVEELTAAVQRPDLMWQARYGNRASLLIRRRPMVRMRRLWQAIITEAMFRGYSVRVEEDRRNYVDTGWLVIEIGKDAFPVRLYGDSTTALQLTLPDDTRRRRRDETWTDADGTPIEKRLGEVFTRIEQRAEHAIAKRAEEQRQAEQRRRQWKAAMAEAQRQWAEDHRRQVIVQRIADVAYADDVRAYAKALRARAAALPTSRAHSVRAWADWAERYADDLDPRRTKAGMPTTPDPEPEQLKPYLVGFSPYGPY